MGARQSSISDGPSVKSALRQRHWGKGSGKECMLEAVPGTALCGEDRDITRAEREKVETGGQREPA